MTDTYVNIKDEGYDFIRYMAKTSPQLFNRAMAISAYETWSRFKDYPGRGGTKSVRWKPLSPMRLDHRISDYHGRPRSTGGFYGGIAGSLVYRRFKHKLEVRFGWANKKVAWYGRRLEEGEVSDPITDKQRRHLAALGWTFPKGYRFKIPARKLFEPIYEEESVYFMNQVEKNLHEIRKKTWKKDVNPRWKQAFKGGGL